MDSADTNPQREIDRRYVCTACDSIVRARWFSAGSFSVGCECTTVPVVPQMGQDETPSTWRVEREDCCCDVEVNDLETIYGSDRADYQCPTCGATYTWDGEMVTPPEDETNNRADENDSALGNYGN